MERVKNGTKGIEESETEVYTDKVARAAEKNG